MIHILPLASKKHWKNTCKMLVIDHLFPDPGNLGQKQASFLMSRLVKDCDILDGQVLGNLKQMLTDGLCGQPSGKKVSREQMELMEAACRKCSLKSRLWRLQVLYCPKKLKKPFQKQSWAHKPPSGKDFWLF